MSRAKRPVLRFIEGGRREEEPAGLLVACHCSGLLYEVINGGEVRCARCRCPLPVKWQWQQREDEGESA